jgi:hypothetical protein
MGFLQNRVRKFSRPFTLSQSSENITLQGIYCRRSLSFYSPHIRYSFYIFLKHNNQLQLLHDDRQSSVTQLFKFFRCVPFASPAHEKQKTRQYIDTYNYYYDTDLSARRVIIILLLLFARPCYTVFTFAFTFAEIFEFSRH